MKMLWTYSPNAIDKLISFMTGEDCGHFALLFESVHGTGVVFESNLLGTHPAFYNTWMGKKRKIIHSLDFNIDARTEDHLWDLWVSEFDGKPYDFGGCIYIGLMKFRHRLFGTAIPKVNKWSKANTYFCDVIYQVVQGMPGVPIIDIELNQMSSPHDLYMYLLANQNKLPVS